MDPVDERSPGAGAAVPPGRDPAAPRVVVVAHGFPLDSETFVVDHVEGLGRHGWQVVVAAPSIDAGSAERLRRERGAAFELAPLVFPEEPPTRAGRWSRSCRGLLPWHPRALLSYEARRAARRAPALRAVLDAARPDVVHAHFGPNGLLAALAMASCRVPLVVDFHGYDATVVPRLEGWLGYRSLLGGATLVAHSSYVEGLLARHLRSRVERVTLGVDPAVFRAPDRRGAWPADLSLLVVGRLTRQKGQHVAIEALAMLAAEEGGGRPSLALCGAGPEEATLRALARQRGVADRVRFLGSLSRPDVAREMARADVLLVPSVAGEGGAHEGFGRVVLEGMACGMAVIASADGGLPEAVSSAGRLVEPGNPRALAAAVQDLVRSSQREDVAARAVARAREAPLSLTWAGYDGILRRAIGTRSARG